MQGRQPPVAGWALSDVPTVPPAPPGQTTESKRLNAENMHALGN